MGWGGVGGVAATEVSKHCTDSRSVAMATPLLGGCFLFPPFFSTLKMQKEAEGGVHADCLVFFFAVATPESNQQPDPNTSTTLPLPSPYH